MGAMKQIWAEWQEDNYADLKARFLNDHQEELKEFKDNEDIEEQFIESKRQEFEDWSMEEYDNIEPPTKDIYYLRR